MIIWIFDQSLMVMTISFCILSSLYATGIPCLLAVWVTLARLISRGSKTTTTIFPCTTDRCLLSIHQSSSAVYSLFYHWSHRMLEKRTRYRYFLLRFFFLRFGTYDFGGEDDGMGRFYCDDGLHHAIGGADQSSKF